MSLENTKNPLYRADIDGMRALAVFVVIFYHAIPELIPGGFVGVDIFFVISGYLITQILFSEIQGQSFSLLNFYVRRIRRIFPALILVLVACLALGWFTLFSREYKGLAANATAGALFFSNIYSWTQSGYFGRAADVRPLLHLWSLGVEEQFYILWPMLLWILSKRPKFVLPSLVALTIISFSANVSLMHWNPFWVFYMPVTRIWELSLGGVLALHRRPILSKYFNIQAWLGFLAIAVAVVKFNSTFKFPGYWALLPTIGAVLLISAGDKAWLNRRLLSNPWIVFVGLISYPLYLWHWPILSFATILISDPLEPWQASVLLIPAVLLSWLTFRFVERVVRVHTRRPKETALGLLALMALTCAVSGTIWMNAGFSSRSKEDTEVENSLIIGAYLPQKTNFNCAMAEDKRYLAYENQWCLSDLREKPTNAIFGDSHAQALFPGLVDLSTEGGRWMMIAKPACPPFYDPERKDPDCLPFFDAVIEGLTQDQDIKSVVITAATRVLYDEKKSADRDYLDARNDLLIPGLGDAITKLETAGKRVYFLIDNPYIFNPQTCLVMKPLRVLTSADANCHPSREHYLTQVQELKFVLAKIQAKHPKLTVIDPIDVLCDAEICPVTRSGLAMYSYGDHLSDFGNHLLAPLVIEKMQGASLEVDKAKSH